MRNSREKLRQTAHQARESAQTADWAGNDGLRDRFLRVAESIEAKLLREEEPQGGDELGAQGSPRTDRRPGEVDHCFAPEVCVGSVLPFDVHSAVDRAGVS